MSNSREEVLQNIRRALPAAKRERTADYDAIPRCYLQGGNDSPEERVHLFIDRLEDYGTGVYQCPEGGISTTAADVLLARGFHGLVVPAGIPQTWLPPSFTFTTDTGLSYTDLDESEGVFTGCAAAIALTGTIILRHSAAEGRRALSLIPDYHLCVVYAHQIADTVAEAVRKMAEFGNMPITTISGPSATSDIEMTRIKGVHGPRTLDVILVAGVSDAG